MSSRNSTGKSNNIHMHTWRLGIAKARRDGSAESAIVRVWGLDRVNGRDLVRINRSEMK